MELLLVILQITEVTLLVDHETTGLKVSLVHASGLHCVKCMSHFPSADFNALSLQFWVMLYDADPDFCKKVNALAEENSE